MLRTRGVFPFAGCEELAQVSMVPTLWPLQKFVTFQAGPWGWVG